MTATVPEQAALELPVHLTCFIGRDRELDELVRLAVSARLLTLTGAGGSGKTRLARETAARIAGSFERIAWVDLASLCDASRLAGQVAVALHVPERSGTPTREVVIGAIGNARTLLVIDNCEHLVDACAELVDALLRACPRLTVLATSREALGVESETAWLVPPLACQEAVRLFVDRARSVVPSFTPGTGGAIDEICRRLDGIPLAIELAAARVRVLTPEQIAMRLDDAFRLLTSSSRTALPRHRTLRATVEWSYTLLSAHEQTLFRRLAVFAGSFALDAAEVVCAGDSLDGDDILDDVSALVDKSLVVMQPGDGIARYRLLETMRQYGIERLREAGELEALEQRHAAYYLAVAEAASPHLFGGEDEPGVLARLFADDDNLRAAALWALRDPSRAPEALRFADALFWYWYGSSAWLGRGHYREGRPYVMRALALGQHCDPGLRAGALCSRGLIALATGDYADANAAFSESLSIVRAGADQSNIAFVLAKLGAARMMAGDLDAAAAALEEAVSIVETMPPSMLQAFAWFWYGWTALARNDFPTARLYCERHIELGRLLRHRTIRGHSHMVYGRVELASGKLDDAFAHFTASLPFHIDLRDGWGIMLDLEGFAAIATIRGHYADAARLLGASDVLRERTIFAIPSTERAQRDARLALLRQKLGSDVLDELLAEGGKLSLDDIVRLTADESMAHTAEHLVVVNAQAAVTSLAARPRMRALALGPLQVFVGGTPIDPSAWGSARPRELLAYLLMHPEGRTKEQVGLAFWPDASAAQMRNNFHVTLHRLRKALGGSSWVALAGERYFVDPSLIEEFDVAEFERDVGDARRALKRQQEGAAAQLEHALVRYRGDFLDGEPVGDWHLEHRDRLQRLYVDSLTELGSAYARDQRHAKAAEAYRRVLARDELHEEALRSLMRSLSEAGERSQALRVYQRFADRLRDELEAEPERETKRLLETLQIGGAGSITRELGRA